MHTPNDHESPEKQASIKEGYEVTDLSIRGIAIPILALVVLVAVFFVLSFGMGKVINNALSKSDGPVNQWHASSAEPAGKLHNMESNPVIEQQQLNELTKTFPTPRIQGDDGNEDLMELHQREDLLLGHYSWVDQSQGKVRIPIARAMALIAQRGLPVATVPVTTEAKMAGDEKPEVNAPLSDGFARTAYEQEQADATSLAGEPSSSKANKN